MTAPGPLEAFAAFMAERHAIYMRKAHLQSVQENGSPFMSNKMSWAWGDYPADHWSPDRLTADPILQQYRFCNVYRELDRVTVWIREHIREPYADHEHLWFMLAISRMMNWPPTLAELIMRPGAWPFDDRFFRPDYMTSAMEARKAAGEKVETGAYMIRAESDKTKPWYSWSKRRYVAEVVLGRLWEARDAWQGVVDGGPLHQPTLQEVWQRFQEPEWIGWGPFMAYQVVVDLRHTRYLREAPDIQTWAALGPGSRRGLNRLHGRPAKAPLSQERGLGEMLELRHELGRWGALAPWLVLPDLSDVQNCLCEFDKYVRVRLGEGRPRALYVPGRGS